MGAVRQPARTSTIFAHHSSLASLYLPAEGYLKFSSGFDHLSALLTMAPSAFRLGKALDSSVNRIQASQRHLVVAHTLPHQVNSQRLGTSSVQWRSSMHEKPVRDTSCCSIRLDQFSAAHAPRPTRLAAETTPHKYHSPYPTRLHHKAVTHLHEQGFRAPSSPRRYSVNLLISSSEISSQLS